MGFQLHGVGALQPALSQSQRNAQSSHSPLLLLVQHGSGHLGRTGAVTPVSHARNAVPLPCAVCTLF